MAALFDGAQNAGGGEDSGPVLLRELLIVRVSEISADSRSRSIEICPNGKLVLRVRDREIPDQRE